MVQPANDRSPPDYLDKNFFIPGRLRYPTPLRPLSPSGATPPLPPPLTLASSLTTPPATPPKKHSLSHPSGEVTPAMASMLQAVSGAAVTMALDTVAKQNAGVDIGKMSGTPGAVAVEVDGDGRAAVFVDVVLDEGTRGKKDVLVVVKREGGALGKEAVGEGNEEDVVEVLEEAEEGAPEVSDVLLSDEEGEGECSSGSPGPTGSGTSHAQSTTADVLSQSSRATCSGTVCNLDGAQDAMAHDRDIEAQRNTRSSGRNSKSTPPKSGPSPSVLNITYTLRVIQTLTLLLQIPFTLSIFALWALIPRPPLPHNTFGIEFVFLAAGFIGFMLLLIGREIPRFKRGVLCGVEGYKDVLRGKDGKRRGFWWDAGGEALVVGCFGVVLGLKVAVMGGRGEGGCLKGLVIGRGNGMVDTVERVAEWGWGKGGVNCTRLVAVVALLGWEV
ncbi:MAG: hypothetical protein M1839_001397 [Geoglossum umbratile]|nr:MAG: hypothetical protein M1839_001397 [Geoglossum umbratile]